MDMEIRSLNDAELDEVSGGSPLHLALGGAAVFVAFWLTDGTQTIPEFLSYLND